MDPSSRGSWSGQLGFVLAAAGSAIGLGNIWMFPYRTGMNGGGAFVLVYLGAVLLIGVPLLLAEVMIGRATGRNPVGAFRVLRGGGPWPLVGWLGVAAGFVILSFYGVVAGWALDYALRSATGSLAPGPSDFDGTFAALAANGTRQVCWQALFMVVTIAVVARGIEQGIERANKVLMPLLFAFMLLLLGYSLNSEGAAEGLAFLLEPRFDELGWSGVLAALGQAFFSLSLGMGAMITYGSYLQRSQGLPRAVVTIAALDTGIAILAGLVIFPLVFSFDLEPGAGPGLVFITLPRAFALMPASGFLATVFFSLLVFAALTSAISLLEVVVAFLIDEFAWTRSRSAWTAGLVIFLLGVPSATVAGFMGIVDDVATNWMLPIGGFFIAVFAGWVMSPAETEDAYRGLGTKAPAIGLWRIGVRFLAPLAVATILLQNLGLVG